MSSQYGSAFWSFMGSKAGAALIGATGQVAGAAVAGRSQIQSAQISADAQAQQNAYLLQAQMVDAEFGKTALTYVPKLAALGAATVLTVVVIKSFSE